MRIDNIEQNTPEWHDFRSQGLGSSEMGSLMGLNKYQSMRKLWEIKSGLKPDEFEDNVYTLYGKRMEPYALLEYEFQYGESGFKPCLFIHDQYPFMRCSFDGFNADKGYGVEIKSPYINKNLIPASEGFIDKKYYAQLQHLLFCSNTQMIKYIVFNGHHTLYVKDVFADPIYQSRMRRYAQWFWHQCINKTDPKRRKLKHLKIFNNEVTDV